MRVTKDEKYLLTIDITDGNGEVLLNVPGGHIFVSVTPGGTTVLVQRDGVQQTLRLGTAVDTDDHGPLRYRVYLAKRTS